MAPGSLDSLGTLQRAVLEILWELGEGTVAQVRERLARREQPAYTTVLSVMQKLEKAGWLTHREDGRAYIYVPACSREEAGRGSLRELVDSVFGGDSLAAFQHLLDDRRIGADELAALRRLIDQKRKERKR
jgi:predicted transcriptional regulator